MKNKWKHDWEISKEGRTKVRKEVISWTKSFEPTYKLDARWKIPPTRKGKYMGIRQNRSMKQVNLVQDDSKGKT